MTSKINVLLMGTIGSGKTRSLRTIPPTGKTLLCLATEPGIGAILGAGSREGDLHGPHCHWNEVLPASVPFNNLIDNADLANRLDQKALAARPRLNAADYRQFITFLNFCTNFRCKVCGEEFGPIDRLGPEFVFAIDGITGLSQMAMDLVAGGRPLRDKPHYGLAQDNLMNFIRKAVYDTKCSVVMIAHLDRRINELTGASHLTVSAIGQAIGMEIPKPFDEVVQAVRVGKDFYWSTTEVNTELKARRLAFADNLSPDFAPLLREGG